jgi:branched-chain amino acid transport system ATP-binding protein
MTDHDGLHVEELTVAYGQAIALSAVTMDVAAGTVVGVVGANGAGKTTLLKTIAGVLRPLRGRIGWQGEPIAGLGAYRVVRRGVAYVPEGRQLFPNLSVLDNLRAGAVAAGVPAERRMDFVLSVFPQLRGLLRRQAGALSGGEQQMVAIGRGLMADPKMLTVDEISLGLAPKAAQEILQSLAGLQQDTGLTLLLVDQNIRLLSSVMNNCYVLSHGQVSGPVKADSLRDLEVIEAYIG